MPTSLRFGTRARLISTRMRPPAMFSSEPEVVDGVGAAGLGCCGPRHVAAAREQDGGSDADVAHCTPLSVTAQPHVNSGVSE